MFTGQAREFPSLGGQQLWARRRQHRALSLSVPFLLFLQLIRRRAATGRSALTGWLTTACGRGEQLQQQQQLNPLPAPPSCPDQDLRLCCRRLLHRHHVRLFSPGLPQLARRLLRDRWESHSYISLLSSLCCFTGSAAGFSSAVCSGRDYILCMCVCVCGLVTERVSARRLVLMLSCVADLQWALGVSAEWKGGVGGVWRCHHGRMSGGSALLPVFPPAMFWCGGWELNRLCYCVL